MNENVLSIIESLPEQLIKAKQIAAGAKLTDVNNIYICGVGGSALPFQILHSLGDRINVPVFVVRDYTLPISVGGKDAVICISYSGNTEETISCYEQARKKGLKIIVIASGGKLKELAIKDGNQFLEVPVGFQPRAATGYLGGVVITILQNSELASLELDLKRTADFLKSQDQKSQAKMIAEKVGSKLLHIYSSRRLWGAAYRWKIEMNENAKREAFCNELPEMNHNEMQGFGSGNRWNPFCIFLSDSDDHERVAKRIRLTSGLIGKIIGESNVMEIKISGPDQLSRIFSAMNLGDLVSYYLAERDRIDIEPVPMVEDLKKAMA